MTSLRFLLFGLRRTVGELCAALMVCAIVLVLGKGTWALFQSTWTTSFPGEFQQAPRETAITAFLFQSSDGFDVLPLFKKNYLQLTQDAIRVEDLPSVPLAASQGSATTAVTTRWSQFRGSNKHPCSRIAGFSMALFNIFHVLVWDCGTLYDDRSDTRKISDLNLGSEPVEAAISKNGQSLLFTNAETDGYWLTKHSLSTGNEERTLLLLPSEDSLTAASTLATKQLPPQQTLRLTLDDTQAAVLDQHHYPRIILLNLLTQDVRKLSAPMFSNSQIHFAPAFLSQNEIAFSVLDGVRWGTVLYHIDTDTYELLSPEFSDQIYPLGDGAGVFVRTSAQDNGNVPFADRTLAKLPKGASFDATVTLWTFRKQWTQSAAVNVNIKKEEDYYFYVQNVSPLLRALGAADDVIAAYEKRNADEREKNASYTLFDWQ